MLKKIKNQNLGTPRQLIGTKGIRKLFFDNETSFRLSTKTSILDLLDFLPGVCLKSCLSLRNRYLFIYLFIYFLIFLEGKIERKVTDWCLKNILILKLGQIGPNWIQKWIFLFFIKSVSTVCIGGKNDKNRPSKIVFAKIVFFFE